MTRWGYYFVFGKIITFKQERRAASQSDCIAAVERSGLTSGQDDVTRVGINSKNKLPVCSHLFKLEFLTTWHCCCVANWQEKLFSFPISGSRIISSINHCIDSFAADNCHSCSPTHTHTHTHSNMQLASLRSPLMVLAFVCQGKIFPALYLASALMAVDTLLGVVISLRGLK